MSTKRRAMRRRAKPGLTPEAIAAWQACDYNALHCALNLYPHEQSPLPEEVISLGVSEDNPPDPHNTSPWDHSYAQAIELQRKLVAAAGWPDCRQAYRDNLAEALRWERYCRAELIECSHQGTGSDLASRRRNLQEAKARVAWRRKLLRDLDEKAPT